MLKRVLGIGIMAVSMAAPAVADHGTWHVREDQTVPEYSAMIGSDPEMPTGILTIFCDSEGVGVIGLFPRHNERVGPQEVVSIVFDGDSRQEITWWVSDIGRLLYEAPAHAFLADMAQHEVLTMTLGRTTYRFPITGAAEHVERVEQTCKGRP